MKINPRVLNTVRCREVKLKIKLILLRVSCAYIYIYRERELVRERASERERGRERGGGRERERGREKGRVEGERDLHEFGIHQYTIALKESRNIFNIINLQIIYAI